MAISLFLIFFIINIHDWLNTKLKWNVNVLTCEKLARNEEHHVRFVMWGEGGGSDPMRG